MRSRLPLILIDSSLYLHVIVPTVSLLFHLLVRTYDDMLCLHLALPSCFNFSWHVASSFGSTVLSSKLLANSVFKCTLSIKFNKQTSWNEIKMHRKCLVLVSVMRRNGHIYIYIYMLTETGTSAWLRLNSLENKIKSSRWASEVFLCPSGIKLNFRRLCDSVTVGFPSASGLFTFGGLSSRRHRLPSEMLPVC